MKTDTDTHKGRRTKGGEREKEKNEKDTSFPSCSREHHVEDDSSSSFPIKDALALPLSFADPSPPPPPRKTIW